MSPTALFTLICRNGRCLRNFKQVIQLQSLNARSIKRIAGIGQLSIAHSLANSLQLFQALFHALAITEYPEVKLHAVLQILADLGNTFTFRSAIQAVQSSHGSFNIFFGCTVGLKTSAQLLFNVQASRTTKNNKIQ